MLLRCLSVNELMLNSSLRYNVQIAHSSHAPTFPTKLLNAVFVQRNHRTSIKRNDILLCRLMEAKW